MGVFSLLQQIYLHNKKEQQSAEIIKGRLLETLGSRQRYRQKKLKHHVHIINYKHSNVLLLPPRDEPERKTKFGPD